MPWPTWVPSWAKRGHTLGFGIGIAQGYATLGRIGFEDRFDYTAIGAVINLASRLCADASDGQILASGRLASAVENIAEIEDLGERQLRGMMRPAPVANLRGPRLEERRTVLRSSARRIFGVLRVFERPLFLLATELQTFRGPDCDRDRMSFRLKAMRVCRAEPLRIACGLRKD